MPEFDQDPTPSPQIFVGGCARSGTTLLGAMLGSEPRTLCLPEAQFIAQLITDRQPLDAAEIGRLVDRIAGHPRYRAWGVEISGDRFLHLAGKVDYAGFIDAFAADYGGTVGKSEISRWVDHSPINIRQAGKLAVAFPRARFIHIYRDGRAVANSLLPLDWGPNDIIGMATYWRDSLSVGFGLSAMLPPDRLLHVKYEDLVRHPAMTMRRVAAFLGLTYSDALLNTGGLTVPAYTRANHALIGSAPTADRINAWRQRLSPREIEVFEYLAGGLLTHLGYALVADGKPRAPSSPERLRWRLRNAYMRRINARRYRARVGDFSGIQSA